MQIITDTTEAKAFALNLKKSLVDADYWKEWLALSVTATPALDWIKQAKISTLLRAQLGETEGTIAWMDGFVIALFQNEAKFDMASFLENLTRSLSITTPIVNLIKIGDEPEKLYKILDQPGLEPAPNGVAPASYQFLKTLVPNIESLFTQWHKDRQSKSRNEKPHIMIVDDDLFTLNLVRSALQSDYEVTTAQNGAEAIAKHLQVMPDIIFLDIGLPDCDGLTLLNYMQQYDKDCRIVMFSADSFLKTRVKAFAGGAKGFLPKPFNLAGFQKHIAQWLSG